MPPVSGQGPEGSVRRGIEPRSHRHIALLTDPLTRQPLTRAALVAAQLPHCTAQLLRCLCRLHHRSGHCCDCTSCLRRPLNAISCLLPTHRRVLRRLTSDGVWQRWSGAQDAHCSGGVPIPMPSETVSCLSAVSVPIAPTWLASSCLELQLLLADDAPAST